MGLNVSTQRIAVFVLVKIGFWKFYAVEPNVGDFNFADYKLWGIIFYAAIVFGLNKNILFKSVLGHCEWLDNHVHRALWWDSKLHMIFPHQFDRKKILTIFCQIDVENEKYYYRFRKTIIMTYRMDYRGWDQLFWNPCSIFIFSKVPNLC